MHSGSAPAWPPPRAFALKATYRLEWLQPGGIRHYREKHLKTIPRYKSGT
jgi:hypothetical protein